MLAIGAGVWGNRAAEVGRQECYSEYSLFLPLGVGLI